jgi:hypothetical protein
MSSPALLLHNETTSTGLTDSQAVNTLVVHPLVLLSVLDHHTRRKDSEGRVIGTLLGRRDGNKVRRSVAVLEFFSFHMDLGSTFNYGHVCSLMPEQIVLKQL